MESIIRPVIMVESTRSVMRLEALGYPVVSPMGHSVSERQCELLVSRKVERSSRTLTGSWVSPKSVPILSRRFYVLAPRATDGFKPHKASEVEPEKLTTGRAQQIAKRRPLITGRSFPVSGCKRAKSPIADRR